MKRKLVGVVLVVLLTVMAVTAFGEETWDDYYGYNEALFVVRPQVNFYQSKNGNKIGTLTFGTRLTYISTDGSRSLVEDNQGRTGYIDNCFIAFCEDKVLWLSAGTELSPQPRMKSTDFGYAACGRRAKEKALILFYDGDYMYIVTEEGYSGYVYRYDSRIEPYIEEIPEANG